MVERSAQQQINVHQVAAAAAVAHHQKLVIQTIRRYKPVLVDYLDIT